jgi:hypothetical protein
MDNIHNLVSPYKIDSIRVSTPNDAFGRLRVSNPYTMFDSQSRYVQNDNWYSNVTGNGYTTYMSNESSVYMTTSRLANSHVIRETKYVFQYQPGKSLLIMNTVVMDDPKANLVQRVGYFGQDNGMYVESNNTGYYLVKRNNGVETRVEQRLWNGITLVNILDLTKAQIFWMDIEWLGVGSVRCGFVLDSQMMVCHTFRHSNYVEAAYIGTACLPCRYEIFNTGTTTSNSTMKQICSTVISEGGYEPNNKLHIQSNTATLATAGVIYPIISIKLKPTNLDAIVRIEKLDISVEAAGNTQWYITRNSGLTGNSFVSHPTSRLVLCDTASTAMTDGQLLNSGFVSTKSSDSFGFTTGIVYQLGRSMGVSDIITLSIEGDGKNTKALVVLAWSEM